jgi:hypothetical protein
LTDALAVAAGLTVVLLTVLSAVATVVVPRGLPVRLTRVVFRTTRRLFDLRARLARTPAGAEEVHAHYAPMSLLVLAATWLVLVAVGFTAVFWGVGVRPLGTAFETSGSSLTTLGFVTVDGVGRHTLAFVEAGLGLFLLALLITYLPTIYGAFQRREALVTRTAMYAGTPPTAVETLERFHRLSGLGELEVQVWQPWTAGFIDIEESHTSMGSLPFFRSPQPDRNWLTASGAVLDAASLRASTLDLERDVAAELCIRAGYLALRRIADFYGIRYPPDPQRGEPVMVTREEWEAVRARLAEAGVPLRADVDEAWLDFAGWRVNYDVCLVALAGLVGAPPAPWSSDRIADRRHRPPLRRRRT